jgi:transcriptional regulator with XRE-family HTH domain
MDIGKSIRIALAQRGKKAVWLAGELGITKQAVSQLMTKRSATGATIKKLADAFNLKASEFIALGEIDFDTADNGRA